jgi:hypothetical protein
MTQNAFPDAARLSRRASLAAWACRFSALAIPAALLASWSLGDAAASALSQLGMAPGHAISTLQLGVAALVHRGQTRLLPAQHFSR